MERQRDARQGASMENNDHERRITELERKIERLYILLEFLTVFKIAMGHLWRWLDKNIRGGRE